ncbi:MAG: hypothetical protein IT379_29690 [Deltaproteobacteria bacterium]|nr:hypothetical protein [Deltaproteobacteria bacterium]
MKHLLIASLWLLLPTTAARADDAWWSTAPEIERPMVRVVDHAPEALPEPDAPRPVSLGLRAAVGLGGATDGMAYGASTSIDLWVAGPFGLGARVAGMFAAELFGDSSSLVVAEPLVLLKLGGASTYLRLGVGVGVGSSYTHEYLDLETSCWLGECGPEVERERLAVVGSFEAAMLWHPGPVELGPTFSIDVADGRAYFLMGFTIGGAVREQP